MSALVAIGVPLLSAAATPALAAIFGFAAIAKLRELAYFQGVVADYRLLPPALVPLAARALPLAELAGVAALLSEAGHRAGALALAAIALLYGLAIALNLLRGHRRIDCGCSWSPLPTMLTPPMLLRNAAVLLLALAALWPTEPRLDQLHLATVLFLAVVVVVLYHTVDLLIVNHSRIALARQRHA